MADLGPQMLETEQSEKLVAPFLAEIGDQARLFGDMLRELQGHAKVISQADMEKLEQVTLERAELVVRVQAASARLAACRDKWLPVRDTLATAMRHKVESELDKIGAILKEMLAAEEECSRLGIVRRQATAQRLKDMANTKKIDTAYKVKVIEDPRFVDRSE